MHLCRPHTPVPSRHLDLIRAASRCLSLVLAVLLIWPPSLRAQLPAPATDQIELRIVSGAGAEFQPGSKQKQRLAVQVVSQDEHPLVGVAVTFRLPDNGASGLFADGQRSLVAFSNDEGEASVTGIQWNNTPGTVSIRVTAVKGTAHAGTLLSVEIKPQSDTAAASAIAERPSPSEPQRFDSAAAPPANIASSTEQNSDGPAAPRAAQTKPAIKTPASSHTRTASNGNAEPGVSIDTQPGTLRQPGAATASGASRPASDRPEVSISSPSQSGGSSSSGKKWILIALIAGGAAAGVGMALLKSSSGSSGAVNTNPISIGSPSISVGHP